MRTNPIKLLLKDENLAVEAISFQNDGFGKELEQVIETIEKTDFGKISSVFQPDARKFPVCQELEKLLFNRFGLDVELLFSFAGPAMETDEASVLNIGHILNNIETDYQETFRALTQDQANKIIARIKSSSDINRVDLAKAKVYGGFSKIHFKLYLPITEFKNKVLTIREKAALILHEVGHAFTLLEYMDKKTTMNQMLMLIADESFIGIGTGNKEYILQQVSSGVNKDPVLEEALNNNDEKVRVIAALKAYTTSTRSGNGTLHYDVSACEALADNFCARFGYAVDNVSGLNKLNAYTPETNEGQLELLNFIEIMKFAVIPVVLSNPYLMCLISISVLYTLFTSGEANYDYSYDRLRTRYLRIREQVVSSLKDNKLPKEIVAKALKDIEFIDRALDGVKDYDTLTTKLYNLIFVKHRNAKKAVELQRLLEELGNNDLFIQAAKLKNL